mgnify:CR=1 FL=1
MYSIQSSNTYLQMATLPQFSEEQQAIIDASTEDCNIVVDSVAGCGKSSTSFGIVASNPGKNILILVYNKRLQTESLERLEKLGLDATIMTYHGYAGKLAHRTVKNDKLLDRVIPKLRGNLSWDVIIVDEAQDMTELYCRFVQKIAQLNDRLPKWIIFGDSHQRIYGYIGADDRFIREPWNYFGVGEKESWRKMKISESFRITRPMAQFINEHLLRENRIVSRKNGTKVKYVICNVWGKTPVEVAEQLLKYYKPQDFFILAHSIKSPECPARRIVNGLKNIPFYVPRSDEEKVTEDEIKGKMVCITFHQAKGLERKVVLAFSFDSYLETIKGRMHKCPNELYVAATRAQKVLVVFHSDKREYLSFMKKEGLRDTCEVHGKLSDFAIGPPLVKPPRDNFTVMELVEHLPWDAIRDALAMIDFRRKKGDLPPIELENVLKGDEETIEALSDINGNVATMAYEDYSRGYSKVIGRILEYEEIDGRIREKYLRGDKLDPADYAYLAVINYGVTSGYKHRERQIKKFDWITPEQLDLMNDRVDQEITSDNGDFERKIKSRVNDKRVTGIMDYHDASEKKIYEFKFVKELKDEHIIQLAIYASIHEALDRDKWEYILYNIRDGEKITIEWSSTIPQMVEYLIRRKIEGDVEITPEKDEELKAGKFSQDITIGGQAIADIEEDEDEEI